MYMCTYVCPQQDRQKALGGTINIFPNPFFTELPFSARSFTSEFEFQLFIPPSCRLPLCIRGHENVSAFRSKSTWVIIVHFSCWIFSSLFLETGFLITHVCVYFLTWFLCICYFVSACLFFMCFLRKVE